MRYWLIKSEPSVYSWEQLLTDKQTVWDGIRNYAARNNLRDMKKGDLLFFYHSNEGMCIVGIAKLAKEAFQDPGTDNEAWLAVEIKSHKTLHRPVTLAEIKQVKELQEMDLIRLGRLSVQRVTEKEWGIVNKMASTSKS